MPESLLYYIAAALLNLLESAIYVWILIKLLPRRWKTPISGMIFCAFLMQSTIRCVLPPVALFRCVAAIAADLLICVCFFKSNMRNSFILPIIFYDLLFICDSTTVLIFTFAGVWETQAIEVNGMMQIIMSLSSRLPFPLLAYALTKVWPKTGALNLYLYPIPIAFFAAQFSFYPYEFRFYHLDAEWMFLLYFIFAALSLYCLIFISALLGKRRQAETRLKIMEMQHIEQLRYVQEIQETYRGLNEFVHDSRHHLDLINSYVLRGDALAAQEYIKKLYGDLGRAHYSYTGNIDIDSVIFSKQTLCSASGIEFIINGYLPSSIAWLDTADICVLLANGIQNAIDATKGAAGATIQIEFKYDENWLLLTVTNPVNRQPKRERGRFVSTKGMGHGYGLASMEAITEKYRGHLRTDISEGKFTMDALLQKI